MSLAELQSFALQAVQKLPPPVQGVLASPTARNVAAVVFAYGLLQQFNRILSGFVLNNWTYDRYDWPREIVLVTGGASGIGRAIAHDLASRGIKVIIGDVLEPTETLPPNVYFYKLDVTSTDNVKAVGAAIRKDHGDVTVLINNAGIGKEGSILEKSEGYIRKVFEVNTISHWWMAQEFLPAMLKRNHGHIVTIASAGSFVGLGEMTEYSSSKASALAFHEGLAQELRMWYGQKKVRTSIIHPIWVKTALIKPILDSGVKIIQPILEIEEVSQAIVKHVLRGRSGQVIIPGRIAGASLIRSLPNWTQELIRTVLSNDLKKIRVAQDAREAQEKAAAGK